MKKALLILALTISGLSISCKKSKTDPVPGPGEIYGKWQLTETRTFGTDASGKYEKEKGPAKYLTIDKSGKIEGLGLRQEVLSYKIIDSLKLEVIYKDYPRPTIVSYKVNAKTLELSPPCVEGCNFRFTRI